MPYNRVNAFGVQHGQVSPEDQFNAQRSDMMRRAQMAALMAGGGGQPQGTGGVGNDRFARDFAATHPEGSGPIGAGGVPLDQLARFDRQTKAGMDMQGLQGSQEMDLQKQRGADSLALGNVQMGAANKRADLEGQMWNDQAGRRGLEDQGMRDKNFIEGAKANMLRHALPTDMGGQGPMSGQVGGTAPAERMLMIMNGQNPDQQAVAVDTLKQQLELLKAQNAEKQGMIPAAGIQEAYGQAQPMLKGDLDRMKNFIRSNNWSIAGNQDQLRNLYNAALNKAAQMKLPPQVYRLYEEELKNTMRDALQENGAIFQSAGSDTTRQNFGL